MTESLSKAPARPDPAVVAEHFADMVEATGHSAAHATAKIVVPRERWVEVHEVLKEHLPFFSYLSAIDWSSAVAVGDPPEGDEVAERYEVMTLLSDVDEGKALLVSTEIPKDDATIPTLIGVFGGADWHERETAEMFGIDFEGHPNLIKLYLPDGFQGHPLQKSFPLLSRDLKPWPGDVDVEDMPSTDNAEGGGA